MDTFKIAIEAVIEAGSARQAKMAAAEYIRTIKNHGADEDLVCPESIEVATVQNLTDVPYDPDSWNEIQRAAHSSDDLGEAMHKASCLAGGWYRRAVTIDMAIDSSRKEHYLIRPSEVPHAANWRPVYTIAAHVEGQ